MQSQVNYRRNKTFNVTSEDLNESNTATQDELEDLVPLQLPAFNISFKKIRYGNGARRVSTSTFEVKCHPDNVTDLKRHLCRISASDVMVHNNENVYFVPHGLPHYSSFELYRSQINKQNSFLYNIIIIPLLNIDCNNIYSEILTKISNTRSI